MSHHTNVGPHGEAPGLVRRQKKKMREKHEQESLVWFLQEKQVRHSQQLSRLGIG